MTKNKKVCIICGKEFYSPPSAKKVTCSQECRKKYASIRRTNYTVSEETRKKLSDAAKGRDVSELQKKATEAASKSPKSGPFETNINAIDWHLISPEGKEYKFHSLAFWARHNYGLFGFHDIKDARLVAAGIRTAKRGALGKRKDGVCTYKGWKVIVDEEE